MEGKMKYLAYFCLFLSLTACVGPTETVENNEETTGEEKSSAVCEEPSEVLCLDNLIQDLSLQDEISNSSVTNTQDGDDWISTVDATAGGFGNASSNPFLYMKFTDDGLVKVDIDDESALENMEWHLSARRYVVRVNGGSSGPSCVGATALLNDQYETLSASPEGISFYSDDFYTASCDLIPDSFGLGDPQVVLVNWWSYENCVKTTLTPFIVELDDGRHLKMIIEEYYGAGQEDCNGGGSPDTSTSANIRIRWSFL
jgi:hypothetical protein